jgi:hypothetical protein
LSIPFRDLKEDEDSGLAGFLRFQAEPEGRGVRAALFIVSSRGEPVEFSFSRIDVSGSFLWRAGEANRNAVGRLARSLFEATTTQPSLLLALAEETPSRVFTEDLDVLIPMCRVGTGETTVHAPQEISEFVADTLNLFWIGRIPEENSIARRLMESLRAKHLLTEPFERASVGLREAFQDS